MNYLMLASFMAMATATTILVVLRHYTEYQQRKNNK